MKRIEKYLTNWYATMQPLSPGVRKWTAKNLWLIALAGVVLMVCMMAVLVPVFYTALTMSVSVNVISPYMPYSEHTQNLAWIAFGANVWGYLTSALLLAAAIGPLHEKKKRGWGLVLWSLLISLITGVVSGAVLFSPLTVFVTAVSVAVAGYFLFEVRDDFIQHKSHKSSR